MTPYQQILELFKAGQVDYKELDHEPVYTSQEAAEIRGLSLDEGAKSLLLKTKTEFVLVVLAGSRKLDSKKLKKLLGVKDIRFATPAEVQEQMHCMVGSCYPFGSLNGLKTYLDKSLKQGSHISFNPGLHDKSIRIKLTDYLKIEQPIEVDVSN